MPVELLVQEQASDVVVAAAERWVEVARESIAARGRFSVALAGGSTPRALYELLASDAWRERINWGATHIFFGDERAVAPDDKRSNFRMAREALLNHLPVAPGNVYRMTGEAADLNAAAEDYEHQLRAFAPLDLVLLGMGPDGHTASLFPYTPALGETQRWCVATGIAPLEPHVPRLTLTFPVLNAARHVWVLVIGEDKAARVAEALVPDGDINAVPIRGIRPAGELVWMLDQAAAQLVRN